jgi:hypothetical protein
MFYKNVDIYIHNREYEKFDIDFEMDKHNSMLKHPCSHCVGGLCSVACEFSIIMVYSLMISFIVVLVTWVTFQITFSKRIQQSDLK